MHAVGDHIIHEIDPTIKCETNLEVIKSLAKFTGEPAQ